MNMAGKGRPTEMGRIFLSVGMTDRIVRSSPCGMGRPVFFVLKDGPYRAMWTDRRETARLFFSIP